MTDRRKFMAALALAPAVIATPAIASIPASQHPDWLALLEAEREAAAAFDKIIDVQDAAYGRFYDARTVAMDAWQAEWDEKAGRPHIFITARPASEVGEERSQAGIRDYNAFHAMMRERKEQIEADCRAEAGLAEADAEYDAVCGAHMATIDAILAYPSRDPAITAHKLQMIIDRHGDGSGDLKPLLASIVGEG